MDSLVDPPYSSEAHHGIASLLRGLSDPTRLTILEFLSDAGERRVVDLVATLGLAQSTVSAHLACLRGCGLVEVRTAGRQSFYRLATVDVARLLGCARELHAATGGVAGGCDTTGIAVPR